MRVTLTRKKPKEEEAILTSLILQTKRVALAKQKPFTLEITNSKMFSTKEIVLCKFSIVNSVMKNNYSKFHQHYPQKFQTNN